MPKYQVAFYETSSRKQPIEDFLKSLDTKAHAKCLYYLQLLEDQGLLLPRQYLERVEADLWALRPEWGGVEFRLFFTRIDNLFLIVHAVKKKEPKLRQQDIETARQRAKEERENANR